MSVQLTNISGIVNHSLSTAVGSVAMPAGKYSKRMIIQTRGGGAFRICAGSGGTPYFGVGSGQKVEANLGGTPGGRIFWTRAETGTETLEILLFNT